MSLWAYHEKTGLAVEAFKLESDASWIDKQKDSFILPDSEIRNITEVKKKQIKPSCGFIKSHYRENEYVQAHFRCNNSEVLTYSGENESEEHKLAKNEIYRKISLKEITFDISGKEYTVDDLPKFNLRIEKHIGKRNIADVLLIFEKEHHIIGNGICIEIQLSYQTEDKENYRTYTRAIEGYSCVWLKERDFNYGKIQNEQLKVKIYRDMLLEFQEKVQNNLEHKLATYSLSIDKKIRELNEIEGEIVWKQRILKEEREKILNNFTEIILEKIRREQKSIEEKSVTLLNSLFRNQVEDIEKKSQEFKEIAKKNISENDLIIKKEFDNHLNEIRYKQDQILDNINMKIEKDIGEKLENIIDKKIINFESYINNLLKEKIKNNEEYMLEKIRESIKEQIKPTINIKLDEELKKEIEVKKQNLSNLLHVQIKSDIDLAKEKVLNEYRTLSKEKSLVLEKEIALILPELKKMAFAFLKNKVEEIVDDARKKD